MTHTNDIGRWIAARIDMEDVIEEFDWDAADPDTNGNTFNTLTDASHGFSDLRIHTDNEVFRVIITRIG
jgi:hypothetical protein